MNKKYWFRGLIIGIIIYGVVVLVAYQFDGPEFKGLGTGIVAVVSSPIILISWIIGWLYGRNKNKIN